MSMQFAYNGGGDWSIILVSRFWADALVADLDDVLCGVGNVSDEFRITKRNDDATPV